MSYHRDGKMRVDGNLGGTTSFNPNSAGLWDNQPDFAEPPLPIEGEAAHYDHYADDDHWEQPGNLFRLMTPAQQQELFENTARAMDDAATGGGIGRRPPGPAVGGCPGGETKLGSIFGCMILVPPGPLNDTSRGVMLSIRQPLTASPPVLIGPKNQAIGSGGAWAFSAAP
jgi:hypothetical protein